MKALEILSDLAKVIGKIADDEVTQGQEQKINPGRRVDSEGNYKWSPPLQQQLDTAKDAVGTSIDAVNQDEADSQVQKPQPQSALDDGDYQYSADRQMEILKKTLSQLVATNN